MFALTDIATIVIAVVLILAALLVILAALARHGRRVHVSVDVGEEHENGENRAHRDRPPDETRRPGGRED